MARYLGLTLKERQIQEQHRNERIQQTLTSRKKGQERSKHDKKHKKKSVSELLAMLDLRGVEGTALQHASTYVPRSYNLDRQLTGLLRHMFVRYPVPVFLYQAFQKDSADPFVNQHKMYRQWFITLAQGGSFSKLVKGLMTSREAFLFLNAPAPNRIHENVWWAKMKAAEIPPAVIDRLIERIFGHYFCYDPSGRLAEVIQFYARFHQDMNKVTFGEITDFLAWKLRQDPEFRLKGRTVSSVIKLTNQWHVLMQKAKLGQNVEWKGLEMPDWEFEARDQIWTVTELCNNRELMNEGRKQKHCVYSYVHWCVAGRSAIFSLRSYRKRIAGYDEGKILWENTLELTRVTIEVNCSQRSVVQTRGLLNRLPTDDEKHIIRQWAGDKGLILKT